MLKHAVKLGDSMMIYELTPNNGQKSFYGKAKVIVDYDENVEYLVSYTTEVAKRDRNTGKVTRLWDGWTATTGKHIKAFCGLNKKEFTSLEMGV